jgi:hypothetical protein
MMLLLYTVNTVMLTKMSVLEPTGLNLPSASADFLLGLHFDLEDWDNILLRNDGLSPNYMTLQLRSSYTLVHVIMAALKAVISKNASPVPELWRSVAGFPSWRRRFDPRSAHVLSAVDMHWREFLSSSFVTSYFTDCSTRSAVVSILTVLVNNQPV